MALHVMDEANRCLQCKVPQCQKGCPINTNIPMAIRLLKENKLNEAGKMLFENNPLTTVCSLICNHENQCEGHCVLGRKGAPVHFSTIENYISSTYANQMTEGPKPSNGMRVAIIGSGPAGITIAIILARYGYQVTIFEGKDKIGGVLRYGIPEFRLPNHIVDVEIGNLKKMGVKFVTNFIVGMTESIEDLKKEGFKGFYVASGAGLPNFMNIPGENANGVLSSNEYLTRVNLMGADNEFSDTPVYRGKNVVVVGGGNTAMDSVRTAKRLGAERAMIVYRRSEEEMPARLEEVKHAKEEGCEFITLTNPVEYIADEKGRVKQVRVQKMELGEPDASGRRRPVPVEGSEYLIDADVVVVAVGVSPNPIVPRSVAGLEVSKKGTIVVNDATMQSNLPEFYAGGDIVRGGATVILAMGDGRRAAAHMDAQLRS